MDAEEALRFIEDLLRTRQGKALNDLQRAIFRGSWQGKDYKEIHRDCGPVSLEHMMRNVGPKLWRLLSQMVTEALGEATEVRKDSLKGPIERLHDRLRPRPLVSDLFEPHPLDEAEQTTFEQLWLPETINRIQDWGQAPDVTRFWGRSQELTELQQWIDDDSCRLVTLYGKGGMGKTALSVRIAEELRDRFEVVIWRSLDPSTLGHEPPRLPELLADLIPALSDQSSEQRVGRSDLSTLLDYLRKFRCLIVLDGIEALFQGGRLSGEYTIGFEGYGELLRRVGEVHHQSCLILTSREKPREIEAQEGNQGPVRSQQLVGLREVDGRELFLVKGSFVGSDNDWRALLWQYDGNPVFLQQLATTIANAFGRDISRFLAYQQGKATFVGEIGSSLAEQIERLSSQERAIIAEFARNGEPAATLEEIQTLVRQPISRDKLLEVLLSLGRRSLLEMKREAYFLHPLVMEYLQN